MEINEDNTQDTPYEQGYKKILAAERKAYMPSSVVGDDSRKDHLEVARDHVSGALGKNPEIAGEDDLTRWLELPEKEDFVGQQVTFIEGEHCEDMIAVHSDTSAATILFGTAAPSGVDVILQKDGEEDYVFISRESWDTVCAHLVETNLHPEWSYARQMTFGSSNITMHKPRGLIVKQDIGLRGIRGWRITLAQMLKRPIYTALELTDSSTVWERWG